MARAWEKRYAPRRMTLDAVIETLLAEHATMRAGLQKAKGAAARGDFETVSEELSIIAPLFRPQIADVVATILGLLIRELGREGAVDEIRVFQQHRPMYQLMKKVNELAGMPGAELRASQDELNALFDLHTRAEEGRVFPRAASIESRVEGGGGRRVTSSSGRRRGARPRSSPM